MKDSISVVLPCYNTRDSLLELYIRLKKVFDAQDFDYEIIFVDDSSPQQDWQIVKNLAESDKGVKLIKLAKNFGQQAAITAGLDFVTKQWIVVMDADLQDKPEEIIRLHQKAIEGYDIVFARRKERQDVFLKRFYSIVFRKLFHFFTETKSDNTIGNFGIYNAKVITNFKQMRESFRGFALLIRWLGFNATAINVDHQKRIYGKTSYDFNKGVNLAFNSIIAFSDKPLRFAVMIGFFISFLSVIYGTYIFIRASRGHIIMGWPSLIFSIWFLGGLTIFTLGIIGLYIGKLFEETKKRPLYVIESTVNLGE